MSSRPLLTERFLASQSRPLLTADIQAAQARNRVDAGTVGMEDQLRAAQAGFDPALGYTPEVAFAYTALRLWPVSFAEARRFVADNHRHSDPPIAVRVSVGIVDDQGRLRGVGMLGIPKARMSMDGVTAEVVRVATDGVRNGPSMLYGALVRAAWALGYDRVLTYTLPEESGVSLRAAGWTCEGQVQASTGRDWSAHTTGLQAQQKPTLFFEAKVPVGPKIKWSIRRKS